MKPSGEISELAAALVAAQAEMPSVGKSGENTFDKYSYAKLEDYVAATRSILSKHGLSIITSVDSVTPITGRLTKKGDSENACYVMLTMTVIHKSGQSLSINCPGEGQDRSDKSTYKAITGARKYAIASLFGLATKDDAEDDGLPSGGKTKNNGTPATAAEVDDLLA